MAGQPKPQRARAAGGRTLILLGVLLALAAGAIVIFVVSQYTTAPTTDKAVIVAKQTVSAGTVLVADASQVNAQHMLITDAFASENLPVSAIPTDALYFTSPEQMAVQFNNKVVLNTYFADDIVRTNDARLADLGTAANGSANLINPSKLAVGSVISVMQLDAKPFVVPGDYVDLLVTECNLSADQKTCETQTTLTDKYVYAVKDNELFLVLSHQDALTLKYLAETGKVELALRAPGDTTTSTTTPVDPAYIIKQFNF